MTFVLFGREFESLYLTSQALALVAALLSIYAFQKRRKMQILNYTAMSTVFGMLHYVFLGAWAGAVTRGVGLLRNAFAAFETRQNKVSKVAPMVFVLLYIICGFLTYQSPISLLPIVGSCFYTLAVYLADARHLRYAAIVNSAIWLTYNSFVFSVVGIAAEIVFILNGLIAIYRYRQRKTKSRKRRSR